MEHCESKEDVRVRERRRRQFTDEGVERAKEHEEDFEKTSDVWNQMEGPSLLETAEGLRRIGEQLQNEASEHGVEIHQDVQERVVQEREEISDRAEMAAERERGEINKIEGSLNSVNTYAEQLAEAAHERIDAEDFHHSIADTSRDHQEATKDRNEQIAAELRRLMGGMKSF